MRTRAVLLATFLSLIAAAAVVLRAGRGEPDLLSPAELGALLDRPLDAPPGAPAPEPGPVWKVLLASLAEPGPGGPTLRLGLVLADPTAARASAESAGELLALEAESSQGKLGLPLWRAVLAGPSREPGPTGGLKLYGCRHSAPPAAGPALEDTYFARLSLARALRELAASEPGGAPLKLLGEEFPVHGGVNFEVQLFQEHQTVRVTFDGSEAEPLWVTRPYTPHTPNDARARASLAQALRERARQAGLGALEIVDAGPGERGVDVRIEVLGGRQSLVARRGDTRLAAHRTLAAEGAQAQ